MPQAKRAVGSKKPARGSDYVSPNQLTIGQEFETPFQQKLTRNNRWVKLSKLIPWDKVVGSYQKCFKSKEGRQPINGRIVIGAVIIKHMLNLSDRETIQQICENVFMQYFLGYSSFTNEAPFDASLFVDIRERLSLRVMNEINEIIITHHVDGVTAGENDNDRIKNVDNPVKQVDEFPVKIPCESKQETTEIVLPESEETKQETAETVLPESKPLNQDIPSSATHQGKLLMDATVAPQNITFPTDLKLLNASREKSEELIDKLYSKELHGETKPRTYRNVARKEFLNTAKKKNKSRKQVYKAVGKQLRFLKRNLAHIDTLLDAYASFPLKHKDQKYLMVLHTVYLQQFQMHNMRIRRVDHRIVNIHQPHVRPIKRGKEGKTVEFGSKIQLSMSDGFAMIDKLSWENFNEGGCLKESVQQYKRRFGYYPEQVLADQIYCTRDNRKTLKELGIILRAKPLGRRPANPALHNQISPGERNPIEGKIGQAKVGYNMECIKAKLNTTSESWIASIILVLNLVNLARLVRLCLERALQSIVSALQGWAIPNPTFWQTQTLTS